MTNAETVDQDCEDENESLGDLNSDILPREIIEAIRALGNCKAARSDRFIGEFFKNSSALVIQFFLQKL